MEPKSAQDQPKEQDSVLALLDQMELERLQRLDADPESRAELDDDEDDDYGDTFHDGSW